MNRVLGVTMRLVAVYDQVFAGLCLRRNLEQVMTPPGRERRSASISDEEVAYFTERLAETTVFGVEKKFGTPWTPHANLGELAITAMKAKRRADLQRCELAANNMLIFEGIIRRAGALMSANFQNGEELRRRMELAQMLYFTASLGDFRSAEEARVLRAMGKHVPDWMRYLSYLPGNDLGDMLRQSNSTYTQAVLSL